MPRHDAAAFELELRDRDAIAGEVSPRGRGGQLLGRNVGPSGTDCGRLLRHREPPIVLSYRHRRIISLRLQWTGWIRRLRSSEAPHRGSSLPTRTLRLARSIAGRFTLPAATSSKRPTAVMR